MIFDKKMAEEKFDQFLMIMDDQLDSLSCEAESRGIDLDFSLDDMDKLEDLFDLMAEGKSADDRASLVVFFARYLGELVLKNYGGKWSLPLEDEKNVNFNTPVIVGHCSIEGLEFAPISVMRGYSLRKRKGSLRRALDADVNPKALDLSDIPEE